jgi:hypothetical protein
MTWRYSSIEQDQRHQDAGELGRLIANRWRSKIRTRRMLAGVDIAGGRPASVGRRRKCMADEKLQCGQTTHSREHERRATPPRLRDSRRSAGAGHCWLERSARRRPPVARQPSLQPCPSPAIASTGPVEREQCFDAAEAGVADGAPDRISGHADRSASEVFLTRRLVGRAVSSSQGGSSGGS